MKNIFQKCSLVEGCRDGSPRTSHTVTLAPAYSPIPVSPTGMEQDCPRHPALSCPVASVLDSHAIPVSQPGCGAWDEAGLPRVSHVVLPGSFSPNFPVSHLGWGGTLQASHSILPVPPGGLSPSFSVSPTGMGRDCPGRPTPSRRGAYPLICVMK